MDEILLDALIDQVIKRNRVNGQFTSRAFAEVTLEFRLKTNNEEIDKDKIKNRIKTLKKIFGETYDALKGYCGFGWNPVTKTFEADEEVWKELLQANPKAIQWKTKPIYNYDKLQELWMEDRAKGFSADTPRERQKKWANTDVTIEGIDDMIGTNEASIDGYDNSFPVAEHNNSNQEVPSGVTDDIVGSSSKTKAKGGTRRRENETVVAKMESVMQNVVDAMDRASSIMEKSRARVYTGEEVYAELENIELEDEVIAQALEFLTENQNKFRAMISLPMHARKNWLVKKLDDEGY